MSITCCGGSFVLRPEPGKPMAVPMSLLPKPTAAPFTSLRPSAPPPASGRRPSCSPSLSVACGPRDNRGPLVRGRTLSTEAILAVQALKRADAAIDTAAATSRVDEVVSRTLARLIKGDLLAALAELQRQGHCRLALKVFVAMRGEIWYRADYAQYAQMVAALARNGMAAEIDDLVADLLEEVQREEIDGNGDNRGLARLLKSLIAAGKGKAVKDAYMGVKRRGIVGDEYLFKVLSKGLRRLGEGEAADEVDRDYAVWCENGGRFGASAVRGKGSQQKYVAFSRAALESNLNKKPVARQHKAAPAGESSRIVPPPSIVSA